MTPSPVRPCVLHRPMDSVPAQQPHSSHADRLHPSYTHVHTHAASHTLTHTHILTQIHIPSHATYTLHKHTHSSHPHTHVLLHTHTLTYTHPHTFFTQDTGNTGTQGQCSHNRHMECVGTAQSPSWAQSLDLPHTGSHWDSRSSLRTRETVGGLRLTQLSPDQTSLLCKICRYNQWTPHMTGTGVHSQCGSFLVKNTETVAPQLQTPFLSPVSTPCCGPRTERQLLPWPPTMVPRRRTQSPWRERCRLRAILTPRPQGHSPSCRISLWGGIRVRTGVYINRPLHPPSWEPIATPFTISDIIGGCICPFLNNNELLKLPHLLVWTTWSFDLLLPRSWEPGPMTGTGIEKVHQKLWVPFSLLITLIDICRCHLTGCWVWDLLACGEYLL